MVRLKAGVLTVYPFIIRHFNSNMVRLKVKAVVAIALRGKFQFQHGAIKSVKGDSAKKRIPLFQFQHGAIKSKAVMALADINIISIPTWCD